MRIFNYLFIKEQKWDSEILVLIAAIYRYAGKQELYLKQKPNEQEIAGYRDVLNVIHESFDAIPITKNYILQLHKML